MRESTNSVGQTRNNCFEYKKQNTSSLVTGDEFELCGKSDPLYYEVLYYFSAIIILHFIVL